MISITCACGCGQLVSGRMYRANGKTYIHRFRVGHNPNGNKGKHLPEEQRRKIGEAHKGRPGTMLGRHHSEASKEKIRQSNLGQKRSKMARANMRKAHLGKPAPNRGKKLPQRSGPLNHNWKGGVSPERNLFRSTPEYMAWNRSVLERSHFRCVRCGDYSNGVHHLRNFADYPDLRLDPENGASLCRECHEIFHWTFGKSFNNEKQFARFLLH